MYEWDPMALIDSLDPVVLVYLTLSTLFGTETVIPKSLSGGALHKEHRPYPVDGQNNISLLTAHANSLYYYAGSHSVPHFSGGVPLLFYITILR